MTKKYILNLILFGAFSASCPANQIDVPHQPIQESYVLTQIAGRSNNTGNNTNINTDSFQNDDALTLHPERKTFFQRYKPLILTAGSIILIVCIIGVGYLIGTILYSQNNKSSNGNNNPLNTTQFHTINSTKSHTINSSPSHTINSSPSHTINFTKSQTINSSQSHTINSTKSHTINSSQSHTINPLKSNTITLTASQTIDPIEVFAQCVAGSHNTNLSQLYKNFNYGELANNQIYFPSGVLVDVNAAVLWFYIGHCLNMCGSICANTLKKFTQVDSTKADIFNFTHQGPLDLFSINATLNNPDMKIICDNNVGKNGSNFVNSNQQILEGGRGGLSGMHFIVNMTNKFFAFCGGRGGDGGNASMQYPGGNGGDGGNAGYYAAGGNGGNGTAATLNSTGCNGTNGGDANSASYAMNGANGVLSATNQCIKYTNAGDGGNCIYGPFAGLGGLSYASNTAIKAGRGGNCGEAGYGIIPGIGGNGGYEGANGGSGGYIVQCDRCVQRDLSSNTFHNISTSDGADASLNTPGQNGAPIFWNSNIIERNVFSNFKGLLSGPIFFNVISILDSKFSDLKSEAIFRTINSIVGAEIYNVSRAFNRINTISGNFSNIAGSKGDFAFQDGNALTNANIKDINGVMVHNFDRYDGLTMRNVSVAMYYLFYRVDRIYDSQIYDIIQPSISTFISIVTIRNSQFYNLISNTIPVLQNINLIDSSVIHDGAGLIENVKIISNSIIMNTQIGSLRSQPYISDGNQIINSTLYDLRGGSNIIKTFDVISSTIMHNIESSSHLLFDGLIHDVQNMTNVTISDIKGYVSGDPSIDNHVNVIMSNIPYIYNTDISKIRVGYSSVGDIGGAGIINFKGIGNKNGPRIALECIVGGSANSSIHSIGGGYALNGYNINNITTDMQNIVGSPNLGLTRPCNSTINQ